MILMCHFRAEPLGQSDIIFYQGVSKMTKIEKVLRVGPAQRQKTAFLTTLPYLSLDISQHSGKTQHAWLRGAR